MPFRAWIAFFFFLVPLNRFRQQPWPLFQAHIRITTSYSGRHREPSPCNTTWHNCIRTSRHYWHCSDFCHTCTMEFFKTAPPKTPPLILLSKPVHPFLPICPENHHVLYSYCHEPCSQTYCKWHWYLHTCWPGQFFAFSLPLTATFSANLPDHFPFFFFFFFEVNLLSAGCPSKTAAISLPSTFVSPPPEPSSVNTMQHKPIARALKCLATTME